MERPNLIEEAKAFAFAAHDEVGQTRKYTGEPYTVHVEAVANLVAEVTDDEEMIAAAYLHDTVEDTKVTREMVLLTFGARITSLVDDLTDVSKPTDGNRKVRKAIDRAHTAMASPDAKTIKLADLIDNTRTIVQYDPDFAKVYLREKADLLMVLQDGHPTLYARANQIVADATRQLFGGKVA
jgi:(p)ppGpp synthase/HD superfamily hydrolase